MWRPAESFCLASLALLLFLFSCTTDEEVVFEPGVEELTLYPHGLTDRNRCPTLSEDARVLSWIRTITSDGSRCDYVQRWKRPAPVDTVFASRTNIEHIDLSDDGRHLVGLISEADTIQFFLWSEEEAEITRTVDLPPDYTIVKTPQWVGENTVFFGALGPEGQGIWCWRPADDSITPVCVRFPTLLEQWRGTYPDLDRSGRWVCFERNTSESHIQTTICSVESGEILIELDGSAPRFWSLIPAEEDGLLYIDPHRSLRAQRLHTNESFYIVQEVFRYDISHDGRWLFTETSDLLSLTLHDLRNLR